MSRRVAADKRPYGTDVNGTEIDSSAAELLGEEPLDMPRVVAENGIMEIG